MNANMANAEAIRLLDGELMAGYRRLDDLAWYDAARMAGWRESMRQSKATIADNRRRMEAKQARRAEKAA